MNGREIGERRHVILYCITQILYNNVPLSVTANKTRVPIDIPICTVNLWNLWT